MSRGRNSSSGGSRTCKPNFVCRCRQDDHSLKPRITAQLKRPTRRFGAPSRASRPPSLQNLHAARSQQCSSSPSMKTLQRRRNYLPLWSCSVWGLPCPLHYCRGGALLPHLFTLTRTLRPGRYIFCGTFRPAGLNRPSRTLSGTLLCGVRTFLCLATAIVRSGCQPSHYSAPRNSLDASYCQCAAGRFLCFSDPGSMLEVVLKDFCGQGWRHLGACTTLSAF